VFKRDLDDKRFAYLYMHLFAVFYMHALFKLLRMSSF